jgi:hypothetical protein
MLDQLDRDLLFLIGLAFLPLAFVALVSAWADRRAPWAALILAVLGAGLVAWAHLGHPAGGYDWRAVPDLLAETVGHYWRR